MACCQTKIQLNTAALKVRGLHTAYRFHLGEEALLEMLQKLLQLPQSYTSAKDTRFKDFFESQSNYHHELTMVELLLTSLLCAVLLDT